MTAETPKLVTYLRSLQAVRDRSKLVFDLARAGEVDHWTWHEDKLDEVVQYCMSIIERDFGTDYSKIPPHCRRNHFLPSFDRITPLLASPSFPSTPLEQAKSLIDLYLVSVLLDAGAGPDWVYTETDEEGAQVWKGGRSEGLAVASLDMFKKGVFSVGKGYTVDAAALKALTPEILAKHLQVSDTNPMAGLEGRCNLLINLGEAIEKRPDVCAGGRPGDMLDYFSTRLSSSPSSSRPILPLSLLWSTLFSLLLPIWPSRTTLPCCPQYALGDIWPVPSLERHLLKSSPTGKLEDGAALVPFHKLTQWLCYSLVEAIESTAGWTVATGVNGFGGGGGSGHEPEPSQTGLPEYRNGGLLMDLGLVELKLDSLPEEAKGGKVPRLEAGHPAVVEWRSITVMTLDLIHERICAKLNITADQLSLAQVLEAATWKGGREIAKVRREGGGPPIDIISDGTVF